MESEAQSSNGTCLKLKEHGQNYLNIWTLCYHDHVFLAGQQKIVKLRQGSGKDRQGMAVKAKGLKA